MHKCGQNKNLPNSPEITLCPPGAWPPDKTTPIFNFLFTCTELESLGTNIADGWPKRPGNSFAISSACEYDTQLKHSKTVRTGNWL